MGGLGAGRARRIGAHYSCRGRGGNPSRATQDAALAMTPARAVVARLPPGRVVQAMMSGVRSSSIRAMTSFSRSFCFFSRRRAS